MRINHKSSTIRDILSEGQNRPDSCDFVMESHYNPRRSMNEFQEVVRARIRARVDNASTLARFLKEHPSTVTKRLQEGGPSLCLDFLDRLRDYFGGWTPAEMVADKNALIMPVSPLEASVLHLVRQMTELERRSLLTLLERPIYTASPHAKKSRLGRAMLTVKEQELVDLFARVKRDGVREGVLRTLRGAAQDDPYATPEKPRTTG